MTVFSRVSRPVCWRARALAFCVGLVAFAGGNLPLFILVGLTLGLIFIFSGS